MPFIPLDRPMLLNQRPRGLQIENALGMEIFIIALVHFYIDYLSSKNRLIC